MYFLVSLLFAEIVSAAPRAAADQRGPLRRSQYQEKAARLGLYNRDDASADTCPTITVTASASIFTSTIYPTVLVTVGGQETVTSTVYECGLSSSFDYTSMPVTSDSSTLVASSSTAIDDSLSSSASAGEVSQTLDSSTLAALTSTLLSSTIADQDTQTSSATASETSQASESSTSADLTSSSFISTTIDQEAATSTQASAS